MLLLLATLPFWNDINTTSVNAQTRRTEVVYYATREDALTKGFRESENYLDLNGVWDFRYFDDIDAEADAFLAGGNPAWDKIQVPGNWELQGYGTAIYSNIHYDFMPDHPKPPVLPETIPGGIYHRKVTIPQGWAGRQVFLNLAGPRGGVYVYVNGREAGYSEDSKSLARFDITGLVEGADNDITLKVYRYNTGSYLEDQDFWSLSGMERDVYLSSEKEASGFNFDVVSSATRDLNTGIFRLRMQAPKPVEVFYELLDKDGTAVADALYNFEGECITVTDSIPSPRLWSAETPELYTLLLRVNGEYTRFHVGFRRIEIDTVKDGGRDVKALLVNGQPVKFKGVNMHEHNPYTGHYTSRQNILEDLLLMREANINAIRTCHYPQPREFYELCDSLGFYVYDEANVESHGMGYELSKTLGNKSEWYPKHIDRILNMYRRTASYPCVTILSLGNEAGNGINFYKAYKELKALEKGGQNRPVVYERAEYEWNTDMIVPQYPGADWFRRMGETYSDRPVCPSEYAHAMGNSTGSLDLQWEQIYAHTHLQGGFIWDWVDQGLYDAERVWTYGGDYGTDMPSDANFCCNGIVNPDRKPHPGFYEVKHVYQDVSVMRREGKTFSAFNRRYFKSLDGLTLKWWIERDGKKLFLRRGKVKLSAGPQDSQEFKVRLPRMKKSGEYRIFFETRSGKDVIAADEILLAAVPGKAKAVKQADVKVTEGGTRITLESKNASVSFDKITGNITSYIRKGKEVVDPSFGIRPIFYRASNDNDYGDGQPWRTREWREAVKAVEANARDGRIEAIYSLPAGAGMKLSIGLDKKGGLNMRTAFIGGGAKAATDVPRIGWRFRTGADEFSYFGRGPLENYWDRSSSSFKRIWTSAASKEFFPYVRPQETGHHTETSWLRIGDIRISATGEPFEFSALRQRVEDLDCEAHTDRPYQWNNFSAEEDHSPEKGYLKFRRQVHLSDIPQNNFTEVCIDLRMSGIGGYDSWGARPEKERTLWSDRNYNYDFTIN